jgi:gluconolactonase
MSLLLHKQTFGHLISRQVMRRSLLMLTLLLVGAGSTSSVVHAANPRDDKGINVKLGDLSSKAPAGWIEEKTTNQMRLKQFKVPGKDGKDPAEIIVFFFGKGSGGSVDDNMKRWRAMFTSADGKQSDEMGKVERIKAGDVEITYLDIEGTYLTKFPPFAPNAKTIPKPNHRMISAVFDSKDGPFFIRLVGPASTVEFQKKNFIEWLKAFK